MRVLRMRFVLAATCISTISLAISLPAAEGVTLGSTSPSGTATITAGQQLVRGQNLLSPNHAYKLALQSDGNLVEYGPNSRVVWATNTKSIATFALQTDSNIVGYSSRGAAVWQTSTANYSIQRLAIQNDGNVVAYTSSGRPVWSPGTGIIPNPGPSPSWNGSVAVNLGLPTDWSQAGLVTYINRGRAAENVPPLHLPTNWYSLTWNQQLLVIVDLERVDRGLPPFPGLDATLDNQAQVGANQNSDPPFNVFGIWAGGSNMTPLGADAGWMYDDGPSTNGQGNIGCTPQDASGCYGHALNIVRTNWNGFPGTPEAGAGATAFSYGNSFAMAFNPEYTGTNLVFTWASELKYLQH